MIRYKIGIIGGQCAGKTTVAGELMTVGDRTYSSIKMADPIYETLRALGQSKNRLFMQEFSDLAKKHFGNDVFICAFKDGVTWVSDTAMVDGEEYDIVCDDIRYMEEYEAAKKLGFIFVYVNADDNVRKARAESQGLVWSPNHSSETQIEGIGKMADYQITNNGSLELLHEQVAAVFRKINGAVNA